MATVKHNIWHTLSLFTSFGTLICCVMPAVFVTLGAGAALAGIITQFPQLVWFSEHKAWVFGVAGVMIISSGILRYRSRNMPCPADPEKARACTRLRKISGIIYWSSVAIYLTGFSFAYILPRLI